MEYKKNQLLASASINQEQKKSKSFFSCLNKKLFQCKSSKNVKRSDYSFISYGSSTSTNTFNQINKIEPQAASTMIYSDNLKNDTDIFPKKSNDKFTFNNTDQTDEISIYISDEQLKDQYCLYASDQSDTISQHSKLSDAEITRRISMDSFNSNQYDDKVTILRQSNSPISEYKTLCIDTISESVNYMHSTKLSNYEALPRAKRSLSPNKQPFCQLEPISPLSSMSQLHHSVEKTNQIKLLDTLIFNITACESNELSSTHAVIEDYEATFVDDVSVKFSDSLRILRDDNDEFYFVQLIDGRKGFVPKHIVVTLEEFLTRLQSHKDMMTSALIDCSINV